MWLYRIKDFSVNTETLGEDVIQFQRWWGWCRVGKPADLVSKCQAQVVLYQLNPEIHLQSWVKVAKQCREQAWYPFTENELPRFFEDYDSNPSNPKASEVLNRFLFIDHRWSICRNLSGTFTTSGLLWHMLWQVSCNLSFALEWLFLKALCLIYIW